MFMPQQLERTVGVEAGVASSVFWGELSDEELTDEFDNVDLFPWLETFPDSFCSSASLSKSCVESSCEMGAVWLPSSVSISSISSSSSSFSASDDSKVFVSGVWPAFPEEAVWSLPWCLSFVWRHGEAGAGGTRHFSGDLLLSAVKSIITFWLVGAGCLRLRKQSSGPRPLTKGGPLCTGSTEDSFSLSPSKTTGSGQECAQRRLGGWFSFGSGLRRLNGRRAAGKGHKVIQTVMLIKIHLWVIEVMSLTILIMISNLLKLIATLLYKKNSITAKSAFLT